MTDTNVLAHKLALLVETDANFEGNARVISSAGTPPPLTAILREIDDTILERTLTFKVGNATMGLIVAGRRLKGAVNIDADVSGTDAVVGKSLSLEDEHLLETAGKLFGEICTPDAKVTVTSGPPFQIGSHSDSGVAVPALAKAWDIDLDAQPDPPVVRFLERNEAHIQNALLVNKGRISKKIGDVTALTAVWKSQAEKFYDAHSELYPDMGLPLLIAVEAAIEKEKSIAIARAADGVLVFEYDDAAIGALVKSWRSITVI